jgi:hypothetical protein
VEKLLSWYSKKEAHFKDHVPLQQVLIKKLDDAVENTILKLKDFQQIIL